MWLTCGLRQLFLALIRHREAERVWLEDPFGARQKLAGGA